MSLQHYNQAENDGIHQIYNWIWSNQASLDAEAPDDPLDVNKIGLKIDTFELWQLVDLTPTWVRIGKADVSIDMSVGALSGDIITVTCQLILRTSAGTTSLAASRHLQVWAADAADGPPAASAPDAGIAVSTGDLVFTYTTDKHIGAMTTSAGILVLDFEHSVAATSYYMVCVLPDGDIISSAEMVF